ncbi:Uncharacterised protein [Escherichia coli]|nr:hypothetical protein [Escherichia coli]VDH23427.1 Uncharacterised protein [Escherichia coli]
MIQEVLKNAFKELGIENKDLIGSPNLTKFEKKDTHFEIEADIGLKTHDCFRQDQRVCA